MISLRPYAELLSRRDIRNTFIASVLGRLPIGITGLAILILVQSKSMSFGRGGIATACYVAGLASVAPALGRFIDLRGPAMMLRACAVIFPATLCALVLCVLLQAPPLTIFAFAAVAGASFPPITVCMRTYLRQRITQDALLTAAYSLEAVLIETIFIAGPMLVALFVALDAPAAAVLFAAFCAAIGTLLFLHSPALQGWPIEPRSGAGLLGPLHDSQFVFLLLVIACFSIAFGLVEIGVTAYATELGQPALAGLILGLMSAGSALGGVAYGARTWGLGYPKQFAATLALMGAGLALLAAPWPPLAFTALSTLAGVAMAPTLTIQSVLVTKTVGAEHSTEAFTWSVSALLAGVGIGFALGGALLEVYRSWAALAASAFAALCAAGGAYCALREKLGG
jgi:MFS family permease